MTCNDQSVAHVTRERVVNQSLCALLLCLRRNHNTTSRLINLQNDISLRVDNARVLTRSTCDEDHVRTGLTYFVDCSCGSRNCLTPYNSLNLRIRSHCYCVGNQSLGLSGKIIRISRSNDHVAILLFHLVGLSNLLITLRCGTGNNTNLERLSLFLLLCLGLSSLC